MRATRPTDYDVGRTLVVAGFPRSGTTWLAEVLSTLSGAGLLFEPFDIRRLREAREAGCDWENFVPPDSEWPEGKKYVGKVLAGRIQTPWTASQLPVSRAWRVNRWVVKMVRGNQMLAWIVEHFHLPPPILLVRHPCAVYDSWVRRGWPIQVTPPRPDLRFFSAYPELRNVVARLRTPEEFFAADWSMQHFTPLTQLQEGSYQLCYYERLRADGAGEIRRILQRWNLPVPQGLELSLGRPSAKASGQAQSRRSAASGGWQSRLARGVRDRIMGVLDAFSIELYRSESQREKLGPDPG